MWSLEEDRKEVLKQGQIQLKSGRQKRLTLEFIRLKQLRPNWQALIILRLHPKKADKVIKL